MAGLVASFVAGLPAQVEAIQQAWQSGDEPRLRRLAHQLKGAAGGYGFPSITAAAARVHEQAARGGGSIDQAMRELVLLCDRTQVPSWAANGSLSSSAGTASSPPTLLVIDDSPQTQELVAARLASERVTLRSALSAREGLALAFEQPPDVVLLDLDLPDMNGFGVCRELKTDTRTASVPVLFLTGTEDPAIKAAAFDLGAVDYVTKPFEASELRARVRSALRTKRYHDLLATRAQLDGLTGLWNRAYFDGRIVEELSAALRHERPLSLALLDLDHFKRLNDTHGHPFGDQVLQAVASALLKTLRTSDVACRYGGEELVVILRETPSSEAMAVADRIRTVISELTLITRGQRVQVTTSIGVATVEASPGRSRRSGDVQTSTLVEAADEALYRAKRAGRNRVVLGKVL